MKAPKRNGRAKQLRPGDLAKWGKLDDQLEVKLVAHIKEGLSYQTCCDLVGHRARPFTIGLREGNLNRKDDMVRLQGLSHGRRRSL